MNQKQINKQVSMFFILDMVCYWLWPCSYDVMIIEMYTVMFHMGVSIDLVSLFPPQSAPD